MFTGLVADIGEILVIQDQQGGMRFCIHSSLFDRDTVQIGDSVSVSGVCLTVAKYGDSVKDCWFDVMDQTLNCTNLSYLAQGDHVNLELAMELGGRLGGHIVQGHVDCVAAVSTIATDEGFCKLTFALPSSELRYIVAKGSVAINGVSLTVSDLHQDGFAVSLIPETLAKTTLGSIECGDKVNIEVDLVAKYVERLLPA